MRAGGTATRDRIVEFIREYAATHGYAPSVRDIGAGVGLSSTDSVQYQLEMLVIEGRLLRTPNIARSYRVIEQVEA